MIQDWTLHHKFASSKNIKEKVEKTCRQLLLAVKLGSFRALYFYGLLKILQYEETGDQSHIQQAFNWFNEFISFYCTQWKKPAVDSIQENMLMADSYVSLTQQTDDFPIEPRPDYDHLLSSSKIHAPHSSYFGASQTASASAKRTHYPVNKISSSTVKPSDGEYTFLDFNESDDDNSGFEVFTVQNSPIETPLSPTMNSYAISAPRAPYDNTEKELQQLIENDPDNLGGKSFKDVLSTVEEKMSQQVPDQITSGYYYHFLSCSSSFKSLAKKNKMIIVLSILQNINMQTTIKSIHETVKYLIAMNNAELALCLVQQNSKFIYREKPFFENSYYSFINITYELLEHHNKKKIEEDCMQLKRAVKSVEQARRARDLKVAPILKEFQDNDYGMAPGHYLSTLVLKLRMDESLTKHHQDVLKILGAVLRAEFVEIEKMQSMTLQLYLNDLVGHVDINDELRIEKTRRVIKFINDNISGTGKTSYWVSFMSRVFESKLSSNPFFKTTYKFRYMKIENYEEGLRIINKGLNTRDHTIPFNRLHFYRLKIYAQWYKDTSCQGYYKNAQESLRIVESKTSHSDYQYTSWKQLIDFLLQLRDYDTANVYGIKIIHHLKIQEPEDLSLALRAVGLNQIKSRPDIAIYIYQCIVGPEFIPKRAKPSNCSECEKLLTSLSLKENWNSQDGLTHFSRSRTEKLQRIKSDCVWELYFQLMSHGHFDQAVTLGEYLLHKNSSEDIVPETLRQNQKEEIFCNALKINLMLAYFAMGEAKKYNALLLQIENQQAPFFSEMEQFGSNMDSFLVELKKPKQYDESYVTHYTSLTMGFYKLLYLINLHDRNWSYISELFEELANITEQLLTVNKDRPEAYTIIARLTLLYQEHRSELKLSSKIVKLLVNNPWKLMEKGGRYDPKLPPALFQQYR